MATLQSSTVDSLDITQAMSIGGNFKRPNLPVACVSKNDGGTCYATTGPVPFNVIHDLNGITASNSNSRFTVPEDGQYFCLFWTIGHDNCGGNGRLSIAANGVNQSAQARTDISIKYGNCYTSAVLDLSAGDYIEANMIYAYLYFSFSSYNKFIIYKII